MLYNLSLIRNPDETDMVSVIENSATDLHCYFKPKNGSDHGAKFILEVSGGQAEGKIEMHGDFERDGFLPFLKQVVYELELIDKK